MPTPTLHFVCTARKLSTGSTFMRANQMRDALAMFCNGQIDARLVTMPERRDGFAAQERWALSLPRNSVYFFPKTSVRALTSAAARILRLRSRGLLFDHVDEVPAKLRLDLADRHICCSYAQLARFRAMGPGIADKARLVLHATDLRLQGVRPAQQDRFAPVYLGDPANTEIPATLQDQIAVLPARDRTEFASQIAHLPDYNLHFAARAFRAGQEGAAKPFLKGFTAAQVGATILLPRDVEDAVHFLGADYPYFYDTTAGPDAAFQQAQQDFGGPIWQEARARLRDTADQSRPETVAAQLLDVVKELY